MVKAQLSWSFLPMEKDSLVCGDMKEMRNHKVKYGKVLNNLRMWVVVLTGKVEYRKTLSRTFRAWKDKEYSINFHYDSDIIKDKSKATLNKIVSMQQSL